MVMNAINQIRGGIIVSGIASIIMGILFLAQPLFSGLTFCYFIGIMIAITGLSKIIFAFIQGEKIASSIIGGLLILLIGLICIFRPSIVAGVITILAGLYIVSDGAFLLSDGILCVKNKVGGGVFMVIVAILLIISGIYLMFAPFSFIVIMTGIVLIADGIFHLVFAGSIRRKIEEIKSLKKNQ
jgi:uncharacterized membrane protein HdeD (DUF308 family)